MATTRIEHFYIKSYKKLLIIPLILLVISVIILGFQLSSKGTIINKDVSLKGGLSATISTTEQIDIISLENSLKEEFPQSDISIRELSTLGGISSGVIIEISDIKSTELNPILEGKLNIELTEENYSIQEIGPSLGASFFKEMIFAIILAFVFMAIVVFITFRKLVPSIAVILSVILDLTVTLAIISIFNLKISTAGIATFLMVIGYSIDTDILLTTKVLKTKIGTLFEKIKSAFKTGITMTLTTVIALTIGLILTNSSILKQMFSILVIALIIDTISTWIMNSSLLAWYVEKNEDKKTI
jgi:preprotein translocase subunit SecF